MHLSELGVSINMYMLWELYMLMSPGGPRVGPLSLLWSETGMAEAGGTGSPLKKRPSHLSAHKASNLMLTGSLGSRKSRPIRKAGN